MQLSKSVISLAFAATALALPMTGTDEPKPKRVIVVNECDFPVYHWLVASTTTDLGTVESKKHSESDQLHDPTTGSAIKISTKKNSLYTDTPIFHLSYNQVGETLYYDMSSSGGIDEQWEGKKISLTGAAENFGKLEWSGEATGTKAFPGNTDMTLTLCAE